MEINIYFMDKKIVVNIKLKHGNIIYYIMTDAIVVCHLYGSVSVGFNILAEKGSANVQ